MVLGVAACAVGPLIAMAWAQSGTLDRASESALNLAAAELLRAIQTRDEATLRKRLADDFVLVHNTGGSRESREGFIVQVVRGQSSFGAADAQITTYDRSVRLLGTDIVIINETVNLQQGTRSLWRTQGMLWRKRSGIWQQVYHQGTPIGEGIVESAEDRANYTKLAGKYKTSDGRAFSIQAEKSRLLMFGPRSTERQDILIPQGRLEYQIARYRLKFSLQGDQVSATAVQSGKTIWTATRSGM
jgi:hypothetical protein